MTHILIHHKVADFLRWKSVYDAQEESRHRAGLKEKYLLRSIENRNEIFLFYEIADLKKAQQFIGSSALLESMQKAGVLDKPVIHFLS